jgi:hypothetical protein
MDYFDLNMELSKQDKDIRHGGHILSETYPRRPLSY